MLSKMPKISQLFSPKCNTDPDNATGEQLQDAANASSTKCNTDPDNATEDQLEDAANASSTKCNTDSDNATGEKLEDTTNASSTKCNTDPDNATREQLEDADNASSTKCNTDPDSAKREQLEDAANTSSTIGVTSNNDDDSHETSTSTTHQDRSHLFCVDLGMWPADVSEEMREYWTMKGSEDCQNLDAKFSESVTKFEGEKYSRRCQKTLFTYTHQLTKQTISRNWLCYSPSQHALYCFPCKLMTDAGLFGKKGYNDWKRASHLIPRHEKSLQHREAFIGLLERSNAGGRIDAELVRHVNAERAYWQN